MICQVLIDSNYHHRAIIGNYYKSLINQFAKQCVIITIDYKSIVNSFQSLIQSLSLFILLHTYKNYSFKYIYVHACKMNLRVRLNNKERRLLRNNRFGHIKLDYGVCKFRPNDSYRHSHTLENKERYVDDDDIAIYHPKTRIFVARKREVHKRRRHPATTAKAQTRSAEMMKPVFTPVKFFSPIFSTFSFKNEFLVHSLAVCCFAFAFLS